MNDQPHTSKKESVLPEMLLDTPNWLNWYPDWNEKKQKYDKPPCKGFKPDDPSTWKTYDEVTAFDPLTTGDPEKHKHIGFCTSKNDPVVLMDIDHCLERSKDFDSRKLPKQLEAWIQENKPYIEYSPNGYGLRIIGYVDVSIKQQIKSKYAPALKNKGLEGQIAFTNNYQTITQDIVQVQGDTVPEINVHEFKQLFNIRFIKTTENNVIPLPSADYQQQQISRQPIPSQLEVQEYLDKVLLLDQNPRILRGWEKLENTEYVHYEYWLFVSMCLHDWGEQSNMLPNAFSMYMEWSISDPTTADTPEELQRKWDKDIKSSNDVTEPRTYKSLIALARAVQFDWPRPRFVKVKNETIATAFPDITEYDNFRYLLQHLNIDIKQSTLSQYGLFIKCDADIHKKYFKHASKNLFTIGGYTGPFGVKLLQNIVHTICVDHDFRKYSIPANTTFFDKYLLTHVFNKDALNLFKQYILTPRDQLDKSLQDGTDASLYTLDHLFSFIKFNDVQSMEPTLYYKLFKRCMMQMLKHHFYTGPFDENNLMLVLQGSERSYKSTFLKFLVPPVFREFVIPCTLKLINNADRRDATKIISFSLMYIVDEFENYCGKDTIFKEWFSQDNPTFIDKYEVTAQQFKRRAFVVGTTNSDNLVLGNYGTRRYCIFPIKQLDTTSLAKTFNWHKFYRHIYFDIFKPQLEAFEKGKETQLPWVLTKEEQEQLEISNTGLSAQQDIDREILEVYDFDNFHFDPSKLSSIQSDKSGRLQKLPQIQGYLQSQYNKQYPTGQLRHALQRTLGKASSTLIEAIHIHKPKCVYFKGEVCQVKRGNSWKYRYFYMPPEKPLTSAQQSFNPKDME